MGFLVEGYLQWDTWLNISRKAFCGLCFAKHNVIPCWLGSPPKIVQWFKSEHCKFIDGIALTVMHNFFLWISCNIGFFFINLASFSYFSFYWPFAFLKPTLQFWPSQFLHVCIWSQIFIWGFCAAPSFSSVVHFSPQWDYLLLISL